jgi:hypothetical protein
VTKLRVQSFALWAKAGALWLAILALAMANGTLREKWLVPSLGPFAALVLSGILLSACVFLVALLAAPWYGRQSAAQWLAVGALWLAMTLAFEFGFGRFVQHKAWAEILEAYTFRGGNLWPLVLAMVLISPWLAAKLRGLAG